MQNHIIIGTRRGNMFSVYSFALIGVIVLLAILIHFQIISFKELVSPGLIILLSVIFIIPYLIAVLKYADKKPMIIVDGKGVSIRKSRLPFSSLQQIDWTDIKDYNVKVDRFRYGETMFLTIIQKSNDRKYYVDLFDLNIDNDEILTAFEKNLQR